MMLAASMIVELGSRKVYLLQPCVAGFKYGEKVRLTLQKIHTTVVFTVFIMIPGEKLLISTKTLITIV